jgi:hypothetical protein
LFGLRPPHDGRFPRAASDARCVFTTYNPRSPLNEKWPCLAAALLFAATALRAAAQQEPAAAADRLWMPEGYQLLSPEERERLSPEGMKRIGTRNQELLAQAIEAMSPEECSALAARMGKFGQTHELKTYERQYLTQVTMRLLARPQADDSKKRQAERQERLDRLLRRQEETTHGFSSEREAVVKEADEIEARLGQDDPTALYLRALRPLRARPTNDAIRIAVRRIVRGRPELIDAALQFCAARQKETPAEGAWYSFEAVLRMTMRDDVDSARRLFDVAIAKNAGDVDCRVYPLLIAEVEGDQAAVARYRPRAVEAWPDPKVLDAELRQSVADLPPMLQARAHDTFEARYSKAHPTDWPARAGRMWEALRDDPHDLRRQQRLPELEREADAIVVLPATVLPREYRVQFRAVALIARAGQGRCDEALAALPAAEREIAAAPPRLMDESGPPRPMTAEGVRALRREREALDQLGRRLEVYQKTGRLEDLPELKEVPAAERSEAVEGALDEVDAAQLEAEAILALGADDAAIAAAWSKKERTDWEHERQFDKGMQYDAASGADRYRILMRSAIGRCLLEHKDVDRAIAVLQPCLGDRRNLHRDCVNPLLEAGVVLANAGRPKDSIRIYRLVEPVMLEEGGQLEALRYAIQRAAPGSLPPRPPPTPGPTPARPPA